MNDERDGPAQGLRIRQGPEEVVRVFESLAVASQHDVPLLQVGRRARRAGCDVGDDEAGCVRASVFLVGLVLTVITILTSYLFF